MRAPTKQAARPAAPAVPGGKALARLHQFEQERGLDSTDVEHVRAAEPLSVSPADRRRPAAAGAAQESPYLAAFQQLEEMKHREMAVPIPQGWRPLGPYAIPHGQTYGSGPGSRPAVAGRVSAVAVDPGNANHVLIGAASGGVWETKDAGARWAARTDGQGSLAIGAIAFTPSNPAIVYAGTGEGDFFSRLGVGLLRSTDGGTNWSMLTTAPFSGIGFYDLAVDPLNANHLLAATTGGLYESTNGGTVWTIRHNQRTWDLSMHPAVIGDPSSTKEVFAGCGDGVFRSADGGTTWSAVTLPSAPAAWERIEVCHAPANGNVVYVFAADASGNGYIWRRGAFGGAFSAETLPPGLNTGQAWYDWFATTAPNNPDVLYVGAIDVHKGSRSITGAWTWANVSAKIGAGDSIHPDQHAIAFSPTDPNVVYVGNDGGVYRSPDGGTSWSALNEGLCITEFEYLVGHPQFDAWLIGGTQDNGTLRYEGEEAWYHIQDGDGGGVGENATAPYTCYHTFYGMGMERSTSGGGWGTWAWIGPNPPAGHSALFYPPLEVNGNVVVQAGSTVFISTDTGTTWASVALPAGQVASALTIPTASRVYAGTTQGNVYRIDLVGGAWQPPVALTQPRVGYVSHLQVDPTNPNRIWATYSSLGGAHVFRSDNAGTSWANVSAGLPNIPVNALVIDPAHPNVVFVAADVGVYRTNDAGVSWTSFSNLLPNALAKDLVFHQPSRMLRVALQSRGAWEIAVDSGSMPDVAIYLRDSVVDTGRSSPSPSGVIDPFAPGAVTYWWQCTDVKVDGPTYQEPALADVDFQEFDDDHGVFAAGLIHENTQRSRVNRVYVQVHNRGLNPALNVKVRVFFADASLGLPPLPAGFWTNFPNNVLPAASPWQAIGPHKVVPLLESGRPEVVGFEWPVPATAAGHTCLLAIMTADNDPIATTETNIGTLVTTERRASLKNLVVINPLPVIGPAVKLLKLNVWKPGRWERYAIGTDRTGAAMVSGLVLSKRLSEQAGQSRLKRIDLNEETRAELERLVKESPDLKEALDLSAVYQVPSRGGAMLKGLKLQAERPEPIVVVINPRSRTAEGSIIQWADDGTVVGGFALERIKAQ
ncbi:MAG TPA: hypothetical protein VMU89_10430 [Thermomicrobiaceae bacterium]|nr:hypothetical protein [Thermomicrobiaceae bacterium]